MADLSRIDEAPGCCCELPVIRAYILGLPMPVAISKSGVTGQTPLSLMDCRNAVMSLKYCR
jgi:hypothetical protein